MKNEYESLIDDLRSEYGIPIFENGSPFEIHQEAASKQFAALRSSLEEAKALIKLMMESGDFQNECGCPACGSDDRENHKENCRIIAFLKQRA